MLRGDLFGFLFREAIANTSPGFAPPHHGLQLSGVRSPVCIRCETAGAEGRCWDAIVCNGIQFCRLVGYPTAASRVWSLRTPPRALRAKHARSGCHERCPKSRRVLPRSGSRKPVVSRSAKSTRVMHSDRLHPDSVASRHRWHTSGSSRPALAKGRGELGSSLHRLAVARCYEISRLIVENKVKFAPSLSVLESSQTDHWTRFTTNVTLRGPLTGGKRGDEDTPAAS